MPTIIDRLVVVLELDPDKIETSRKRAAASLLEMADASKKAGRTVEGRNSKLLDSFSVLQRRALMLAAIFTGGMGVKAFVESTVRVDNALGLLSPQLHTSVGNLAAWSGAMRAIGGKQESIISAIGGLVNDLQTFSLTGESRVVPVLRALRDENGDLAVKITDAAGHLRDTTDILLDISEWAHKQNDPARAAAVLRMLGFDQDGINLMLKGKTELSKTLNEMREVNKVSVEDAKAAAELTESWNRLIRSSQTFGRSLLTDLTPALKGILGYMSSFVEQSKKQHDDENRFFKLPWSERAKMSWQETIHPGSTPLGGAPWPDEAGRAGSQGSSGLPPAPGDPGSGKGPTPEVLDKAVQLLRSGGSSGDLQRFMAQNGYPMSGAWCGEFAAAVVRSSGGIPPKGAAIASNWRKWGVSADTPKPGDVAVRNGAPTGATGSHVGFVTKVYPDGSFDMVGGNQGQAVAHRNGGYSFRRGVPEIGDSKTSGGKHQFLPDPAPGVPWLGRSPSIKVVKQSNTTHIDRLDVSAPNATDAPGIAREIGAAMENHGLAESP